MEVIMIDPVTAVIAIGGFCALIGLFAMFSPGLNFGVRLAGLIDFVFGAGVLAFCYSVIN